MTLTFQLASLEETELLARAVAQICQAGDVIALFGTLGAGKTSFARSFIQSLGVGEEVPSPTFTLVQTYPLADHDAEAIWHFDMYRISDAAEAYELDIEDAFDTGISLIEWPEKLGDLLPSASLKITLTYGEKEGTRTATIETPGSWEARLASVTSEVSDLTA